MENMPPDDFRAEIERLRDRIEALENQVASVTKRQYLPMRPFLAPASAIPFMAFSTCNAGDFLHPRYAEICDLIKHPFQWHRKLWEWVFVIHHLLESGVVREVQRLARAGAVAGDFFAFDIETSCDALKE